MNHHELRKSFLEFFEKRGHKTVASAPVIPYEDPTLMFTNAGMNQFKEVLLGNEKRSYRKAASVQKCIRVSGKHNDFELVGYDGYHHTFFEMLGNWSFGDYYKKEAIEFAWEYLTRVLQFPENRLAVSIYSEDDESHKIWRETVKLPESRIHKLGNIKTGNEDNFWSMGDTGPCGFCTEIHYRVTDNAHPDLEKDYRELWNLVFMEFTRDASGKLSALENKNVDTGMGLERLQAILCGKNSNYHTDLFMPLISRLEEISGCSYAKNESSFQVVVDHIRALTFSVADGGHFSNEGRGYVLRKILRRASRHLGKLNVKEPALHRLVDDVVSLMAPFYPELAQKKENVKKFIGMEEEKFLKTLETGTEKFRAVVQKLKKEGGKTIPGKDLFELYDTYGFPFDITKEAAGEQGLTVDSAGFDRLMREQKERGRQSWEGKEAVINDEKIQKLIKNLPPTRFTGYESMETESRVLAVIAKGELHESYEGKDDIILILESTPFYAESGGQTGDKGSIHDPECEFSVFDTQKSGPYHLHLGRLNFGTLRRESRVMATVDRAERLSTMRNHTATHMLQAALRKTAGDHIVQAGSSVSPERLRFDFRHYEALTPAQIADIENLVNLKIRENLNVEKNEMEKEEAIRSGATAIFGEKYGEKVRVITIPGYSRELCGGTHLDRTGSIGLFMILSESSIASGIRRIEAVTGEEAFQHVQNLRKTLKGISEALKTSADRLEEKIADLLKKKKESAGNKMDPAAAAPDPESILKNSFAKKDSLLVIQDFDSLDGKAFDLLGDRIKGRVRSGIILLLNTNREENKFSLLLLVTEDLVKKGVEANRLIREISAMVNGTGGGRKDRAQGGGKDISQIPRIISRSRELLLNSL